MTEIDSPTRVLIVEDEPFARLASTEYLRAAGLDVVSARNAEEAQLKASRQLPQVVICDWQLGDGPDGVDVARHIKDNFDAEVILVTGQPLARIRERASGLEIRSFFQKPLSLERLLKEIISIDV